MAFVGPCRNTTVCRSIGCLMQHGGLIGRFNFPALATHCFLTCSLIDAIGRHSPNQAVARAGGSGADPGFGGVSVRDCGCSFG